MAGKDNDALAALMRSLGIEPRSGGPSTAEIEETVTRTLRRLGWDTTPVPFPRACLSSAQAGPKLKAFRERSGWTATEISERTGVPLQILEAFEAGEPFAEDSLLPFLEELASACCCSLGDLGLEHVVRQPVRPGRRGCSFDPWG